MYCDKCGRYLEKGSKRCKFCGFEKGVKSNIYALIILLFLVLFVFGVHKDIGNYMIGFFTKDAVNVSTQNHSKEELIDEALMTVYTVYTDRMFGSGFLYNDDGIIVTNAHVVEGAVNVTVTSSTGLANPGTVIGYSIDQDLAVISVPNLVGLKSFPINKTRITEVGQDVFAISAPTELEDIVTEGSIKGNNRSFNMNLDTNIYKGLYQTNLPLEPGGSGGPLIDISTGEIIAMNTMSSDIFSQVSFSIPLYNLGELIDQWIAEPMHESEIIPLFYNDQGQLFYDNLW